MLKENQSDGIMKVSVGSAARNNTEIFGSCKCIAVLCSSKFGSRCDCVIIRALIQSSLFKDNTPSLRVYSMDT